MTTTASRILDRDEHMRPQTTMESLARAKPSFTVQGEKFGFDAVARSATRVERINHVHHAGNSSGIVDGAAAVLIGDRGIRRVLASSLAPASGLRLRSARSRHHAHRAGLRREKALKRAGMKANDIDLWELNEAFAAVVLRFMEALALPHDKINVNGGAIAMGHPLGATGAMILGTLLDELERRDQNTGLVTLCVGAGMGTATIIERV